MRECMRCGRWYHRRDRIEVWTTRNPGHRTGWVKQSLRVCLQCAPVQQSRRVLMLVSVRLGGLRRETTKGRSVV
jgi:hypothetical protein